MLVAACSSSKTATSTATAEVENKPEKPLSEEKRALVRIETEFGSMTVMLYNETPQHRDNFLKLAEEGFYDGTIFHRVIPNFMIQGGDPQSKEAAAGQALGSGGPGYTIPAEFNPSLIHKKGALAAARQGDAVNPEKRSSGSQFYICQGQTYTEGSLAGIANRTGFEYSAEQKAAYAEVGGTPHLDGGYTVFGEIIEGLEVIDKIAAVARDSRDRPNADIGMTVSVISR